MNDGLSRGVNRSMNRSVIDRFDDRARDRRSLPADPPMSLSWPAGAV